MSKIRFISRGDAADLIGTMPPAVQTAILAAYDEAGRQIMATPQSTPDSMVERAQLATVVLETTELGVPGRAALSWMLEGSGFRVYMEHVKQQMQKPVTGSIVGYTQYEGTMTTVFVGW